MESLGILVFRTEKSGRDQGLVRADKERRKLVDYDLDYYLGVGVSSVSHRAGHQCPRQRRAKGTRIGIQQRKLYIHSSPEFQIAKFSKDI